MMATILCPNCGSDNVVASVDEEEKYECLDCGYKFSSPFVLRDNEVEPNDDPEEYDSREEYPYDSQDEEYDSVEEEEDFPWLDEEDDGGDWGQEW